MRPLSDQERHRIEQEIASLADPNSPASERLKKVMQRMTPEMEEFRRKILESTRFTGEEMTKKYGNAA